jgi:uncharacterized protein with LGFP repeats
MNPTTPAASPVRDVGAALSPLLSVPAAIGAGGKGEIDKKIEALTAAKTALGAASGPEREVPGGRARSFERGDVYWSPSTGARAVTGETLARYTKAKGPRGVLGFPVTDLLSGAATGTKRTRFEGGTIYESAATGAHEVHGEIYRQYRRLGEDAGFLGLPTSDELATPGGGRRNEFQHGTIYYSTRSGAFEVHGAIRDRYLALGGPGGWLGYPLADETPVLDGNGKPTAGRFSRFEGATIYWSPSTGAFEVHGRVRDCYEQMGGPRSLLGYPTSNETGVAGTDIRYNDFQKGIIHYRPTTGARVLTELRLFLDRVAAGEIDDGRSGWLVTADHTAEIVTYVTVEANGRVLQNNTRMPSGHSGSSYDWDKTYVISPVSSATKIHVKIKVDDWDQITENDYLGTLDRTFDIKSCFGLDNGNNGIYFEQPATSKGGDLPRLSSLRFNFRISPPSQPPDFSVFRRQGWWSYDNFSTATLPRSLFAETFTDVEIVEGTLDEILNPFDTLWYELVYKGVASKGNCFGMSLEGAFGLACKSLFAEPIYQYFATGTRVGDIPESQIAPMIHKTINMKHGYQVGADAVSYAIDRLTSLDAIRPLHVYDRVKYFLAKRDWPLISMMDLSDFSGHAVLAYRCVDGAGTAPHKIFVADPNVVWSEATGDPSWLEIAKDDTFKFVSNGKVSYQSSKIAKVLPGTLMFELPFHKLSASPRTPFWEVLLAITELLGLLIILGGDAEADQVTADGATFYDKSRGTRSIVPGSAPGLARVPLLDTIGPLPELYARHGRAPEKLKIDVRGRKQGSYRHGLRTATHAVTVDTPVAANDADTILLVNGNTAAPTVEINTTSAGKTARVETAAADESTSRTSLSYSVDLGLATGAIARVMPRGLGLLVTQAGPPKPFDVRIRSSAKGGIRESKVSLTPGAAGETLAVHPERSDAPHGPLVIERWSSASGGVIDRSVSKPG